MSDTPKLTQAEIDAKNLRLYASLFREYKWESDVLHWSVFAVTLDEIATRIDAARLAEIERREREG